MGTMVIIWNEVFIAEDFGQRIRKINPNGIITTIAGNGKCGFSGDVEYNHSEHGLHVQEQNIMFKVKEFCFGHIAKSMYSTFIYRALGMSVNDVKLKGFYNDKKTSDVKIKMKDSFLFCHKKILSSTSQLFRSMFESNSSFADLVQDTDGIDVFIPDCDEEILMYIIKHCYGMKLEIDPKHVVPLIEMAHLHEIEELMNIRITFDNFFEITQCLEHKLNSEIMSCVVSNLINFAISNYKKLFKDEHDIRKLPVELLIRIVHKMTQRLNKLYITSLSQIAVLFQQMF